MTGIIPLCVASRDVAYYNIYWCSGDEKEVCYILGGKVKVTAGTETAEFGAGDLVTFPSGLDCVWEVIEPVRKHYKFG